MVFGLSGQKTSTARRNEYNSLKKIMRRVHTPSLACQRNDSLDDCQKMIMTSDPHEPETLMNSPPLDITFQKSSEKLSMLNESKRLPIKVDVSVKILPKTAKSQEPQMSAVHV